MSQHIPLPGTTRRPWLKSCGHYENVPGNIRWTFHCSGQVGTSCYKCTGYCQCTASVPARPRATPPPMSTSSSDHHYSGYWGKTQVKLCQVPVFKRKKRCKPVESDRPRSSYWTEQPCIWYTDKLFFGSGFWSVEWCQKAHHGHQEFPLGRCGS